MTSLRSPCLGLAAPSPLAAELTAALAALEAFASQTGARAAVPIMLRFSDDGAAALVAGTYDPPALGRLRAEVQRCLNAERRRRIVWLAGWRPLSRHVWGERSLALAQFARVEGCWGPVPTPLASSRVAGAPPTETCPVCFDDYDDPFPHTVDCSPAPRERWACALAVRAHRLCRACDAITHSLRPQLTLPAPSAARPVALTLTVTFSRHICRPRVAPAVRVPCGRDPLPGAACQTALGFLLCVVCVVLS